jgi:hypothetical protein
VLRSFQCSAVVVLCAAWSVQQCKQVVPRVSDVARFFLSPTPEVLPLINALAVVLLHRIEPGAVPEVPRYANPMTFGRWMEMKGLEAKGQRTPGVLRHWVCGKHACSPSPTHCCCVSGEGAHVESHRNSPRKIVQQ